jgi:hypothetical protein
VSSVGRIELPLDWESPSDDAIAQALDRQQRLYADWGAAQSAAREAEQAVAQGRADDEQRRAVVIAEGEADPGAKSLDKLTRAASDAATRRDVLAQAYRLARVRALEVAAEREHEWQKATGERLDVARSALADLVSRLEEAFNEYAGASIEHVIATRPEVRASRAGKIARAAPRPPETFDEWRQLGSRTLERV